MPPSAFRDLVFNLRLGPILAGFRIDCSVVESVVGHDAPCLATKVRLELVDMSDSTIRLDKLDAACRQLRTAITLWFNDGDPVSVHTLAFAAYEIIHVVSKKRNPHRRDLLFDTLVIKDDYRRDWNDSIKRHANFFKHADRDPDKVIEFNPIISEMFILFSILGRELCGEPMSDEESTFRWRFQIHKPEFLTDNGKKLVADTLPVENIEYLRTVEKREFFQAFMKLRRDRRGHTLRVPGTQ